MLLANNYLANLKMIRSSDNFGEKPVLLVLHPSRLQANRPVAKSRTAVSIYIVALYIHIMNRKVVDDAKIVPANADCITGGATLSYDLSGRSSKLCDYLLLSFDPTAIWQNHPSLVF